MRLMIIGQLDGFISAAGKIALQRGAKVIHCEDTAEGLGALRNGARCGSNPISTSSESGYISNSVATFVRLEIFQLPATHRAPSKRNPYAQVYFA